MNIITGYFPNFDNCFIAMIVPKQLPGQPVELQACGAPRQYIYWPRNTSSLHCNQNLAIQPGIRGYSFGPYLGKMELVAQH